VALDVVVRLVVGQSGREVGLAAELAVALDVVVRLVVGQSGREVGLAAELAVALHLVVACLVRHFVPPFGNLY
jgi:hypothetical protein